MEVHYILKNTLRLQKTNDCEIISSSLERKILQSKIYKNISKKEEVLKNEELAFKKSEILRSIKNRIYNTNEIRMLIDIVIWMKNNGKNQPDIPRKYKNEVNILGGVREWILFQRDYNIINENISCNGNKNNIDYITEKIIDIQNALIKNKNCKKLDVGQIVCLIKKIILYKKNKLLNSHGMSKKEEEYIINHHYFNFIEKNLCKLTCDEIANIIYKNQIVC